MDEEKTELQELKEMFSRAQEVNYLRGGKPLLILNNDQSAKDLEYLLNSPTVIRGKYTFTRQSSFIDYVNEHKSVGTRVYVPSALSFLAVINHASHGDPQWNNHTAELQLKQTAEWVTWKGANQRSMNQRDFAQFIEDNMKDVVNPVGAALLDLLRTIKLTQTLEIGGEVNERGDLTSQMFDIKAKNSAGAKMDVELPGNFTIAIAPYEDGAVLTIDCRLRFKIDPPKMTFSYEIRHIDKIEREAVDKIAANIKQAVQLPVWYGNPPS